MTASKPWVKLYVDFPAEVGSNSKLPAWNRILWLALARLPSNPSGHTYFMAGELADLLGIDPANVAREVKKAIDYGLVGEGSTSRCIVIPHYRAVYGRGDHTRPCPFHGLVIS